jgi:uncharacterized tellurite resistance protein B-like protein
VLDTIRKFFAAEVAAETDEDEAIRRATAALYAEMMRQDEKVSKAERHAAVRALESKFDMDPEQARELLALAEAEGREATDYYQFTSLIKDRFSLPQKRRVIEQLWQVAVADGVIDPYEEHMVRKIAELLYVPHADFIAAKHRALETAPGRPGR